MGVITIMTFVIKIKKNKAYSLIELIVVMVVISILVGMVIPQYQGVLSKNRVRAARGVMESIRGAMEMYRANYDGYPATTQITGLVSLYRVLSPYLPVTPNATFKGFISYSTAIQVGTKPTCYTLSLTAKTTESSLITASPSILDATLDGDKVE